MLGESHYIIRRIIRFLLLPYCYFKYVPWDHCTRSRLGVIWDFLYIFFVLKYFPDNYGACRFWERSRQEWEPYYGSTYNPHTRRKLRKLVQRYPYQIIFDDKDLFDQFAQGLGLAMPRAFGSIVATEPYRKRIAAVMRDMGVDELFIKPITGRAGQGIMKAVKGPDGITVRTATGDIGLDQLEIKVEHVLQEGVRQHPAVSRIAPFSVNTIRIVAMLGSTGKVLVIGACMRFGSSEDTFIDNVCAGGIAVGMDATTGRLNSIGYSYSGQTCTSHPATGVVFDGIEIPYWRETLAMVRKLQESCSFYRLTGLDIAITADGPVLIEANANPDVIGIEMVTGPTLDKKEIYDEFCAYDLLINRKQKALNRGAGSGSSPG